MSSWRSFAICLCSLREQGDRGRIELDPWLAVTADRDSRGRGQPAQVHANLCRVSL